MNNKKTLVALLFIFLVVIVGITYYWREVRMMPTESNVNFIEYKDPGFTEDEVINVQEKISQLKADLQEANNDETKFNRLYNIALQYYVLGEYGKAKEYIDQALELRDHYSIAWSELYVINVARRDYKGAEKAIDRAIEIDRANPQNWKWKIQLAQENLEYSDTELDSLFQDAITTTQDSADILSLYAKYLEEKGRDADAIKAYEKAQESYPDWKDLYQAEIDRIKAKFN